MKPTVAIIGASPDRRKFGNKAVRAFSSRGYQVFPVNPHATLIEGIQAYPSVLDVPLDSIDLVSMYVRPEIGILILPDLARKTVGEIMVNPGAESPALLAKGRELGLPLVATCSILAIGLNPHDF
jgi:predicted CoA-binding protein